MRFLAGREAVLCSARFGKLRDAADWLVTGVLNVRRLLLPPPSPVVEAVACTRGCSPTPSGRQPCVATTGICLLGSRVAEHETAVLELWSTKLRALRLDTGGAGRNPFNLFVGAVRSCEAVWKSLEP